MRRCNCATVLWKQNWNEPCAVDSRKSLSSLMKPYRTNSTRKSLQTQVTVFGLTNRVQPLEFYLPALMWSHLLYVDVGSPFLQIHSAYFGHVFLNFTDPWPKANGRLWKRFGLSSVIMGVSSLPAARLRTYQKWRSTTPASHRAVREWCWLMVTFSFSCTCKGNVFRCNFFWGGLVPWTPLLGALPLDPNESRACSACSITWAWFQQQEAAIVLPIQNQSCVSY